MNRYIEYVTNKYFIGEYLTGPQAISSYARAKGYFRLRVTVRSIIRNGIMMTLGVLVMAFGLNSFLVPNHYIDGGVTGISLLASHTLHLPLSLLLILLNIPFIIMAASQISRNFAIKTSIGVLMLALCVAVVPFPVVTHDKLLISIFGGFFIGTGIGLGIRGGSVIDGTEVLAIYLSRFTSMTMGDIVLVFNVIIFAIASYFLGVEAALYSVLAYFVAAKSVDFVVEGIDEYIGVTIVSPKHEEIRKKIIQSLGRGVTLFDGKRGYMKRVNAPSDTEIVFTVITRLEITRLKTEIHKIDPNAFIVMHNIKDIHGCRIKKKPWSK